MPDHDHWWATASCPSCAMAFNFIVREGERTPLHCRKCNPVEWGPRDKRSPGGRPSSRSTVTITREAEADPAALADFISGELDRLGAFVLAREEDQREGYPRVMEGLER